MANGDVFTREEGEELRRKTGVQGIMSARGLLANPVRRALPPGPAFRSLTRILRSQALFSGYSQTPVEAVQVHCCRSRLIMRRDLPLFYPLSASFDTRRPTVLSSRSSTATSRTCSSPVSQTAGTVSSSTRCPVMPASSIGSTRKGYSDLPLPLSEQSCHVQVRCMTVASCCCLLVTAANAMSLHENTQTSASLGAAGGSLARVE